MSEVLSIQRTEHASIIGFNRPDKLNAISSEVERALCDVGDHPDVREAPCVVFTGSARAFSAGADRSEWRDDYSPETIMSFYRGRGTGVFADRVAALPMPTLSAISGWCIGGGLELVVATDFRIAETSARLRLPEVRLGILPSWGGTQRIVRLLGPARAKEIILLREELDAEEALRLGLVTEVVGEGESLARCLELAEYLSGLPSLAVSVTKQVIDALPETSGAAGLALERLAYGMLAQTTESARALQEWSA